MQDIINEIISLDKIARERVEKAREEQLRIHRETEETEIIQKNEFFERETKRLDIARDTQQKKIDKKIAELDLQKQKYFERLDDIIKTNKDEWQSEIYKRITGA